MWDHNSIYSLREKLRLTQKEFGDLIGVSRITVNHWENKHSEPSVLARRALDKASLLVVPEWWSEIKQEEG